MASTEEALRWLDEFQRQVHETAVEKGHWDQVNGDPHHLLAKLALVSCEVSEAIEEVRLKAPRRSAKIQQTAEAEELADVLIRLLDYAEARGVSLGRAAFEKALFNRRREHKHGRRC